MQLDKAPFSFNSFLRSRKRRELNMWNRKENQDEMPVLEVRTEYRRHRMLSFFLQNTKNKHKHITIFFASAIVQKKKCVKLLRQNPEWANKLFITSF